ncbi:MAG TPA: four helix bundle protein [Saprospiraceae bacterium]|nr:four helix bundle protein [Saprospiraceae bacterium]
MMNNMKSSEEYAFPFERYDVWKLSVDMTLNIYAITAGFPSEEKFGLISQLRRASSSVGANIAEGVSRLSEKEKARFLEMAFGSLMEVAHFTMLSRDLNFISIKQNEEMRFQIFEISNKINSLHKKMLGR